MRALLEYQIGVEFVMAKLFDILPIAIGTAMLLGISLLSVAIMIGKENVVLAAVVFIGGHAANIGIIGAWMSRQEDRRIHAREKKEYFAARKGSNHKD